MRARAFSLPRVLEPLPPFGLYFLLYYYYEFHFFAKFHFHFQHVLHHDPHEHWHAVATHLQMNLQEHYSAL